MELSLSTQENRVVLFSKGDRVAWKARGLETVHATVSEPDYYASVKDVVPDGPILVHIYMDSNVSEDFRYRYGRYQLVEQDELMLL